MIIFFHLLGPSGFYILENLQPMTTYDLRFASKNLVGFSEWGPGKQITMPQRGPPEKPRINTMVKTIEKRNFLSTLCVIWEFFSYMSDFLFVLLFLQALVKWGKNSSTWKLFSTLLFVSVSFKSVKSEVWSDEHFLDPFYSSLYRSKIQSRPFKGSEEKCWF